MQTLMVMAAILSLAIAGARTQPESRFDDWSEVQFRFLDLNQDTRISRAEWHFELEDFARADRNRNDVLTLSEFVSKDKRDYDRNVLFYYLDLNSDNRLDETEWQGSAAAFYWLDINRNGYLTRHETAEADLPAGPSGIGRGGKLTVIVTSRQPWVDTGLDLWPGDRVTVTATGHVAVTAQRDVIADPNGVAGKPAADKAPRPQLAIGALLGSIAGAEPFVVGRDFQAREVTEAGRLYLGINDDVLTDNTGQFRATVTVSRR